MGDRENRLTISAVIEKIEDACDFVSAQASAVGLDDEAIYHCHLSVEEVLTNVIEHGYQYAGEDAVIDVVCKATSDVFIITVIDDAEAFNPLSLSDPDPAKPLIEREGGGWGVFFVKKYMDRVSYYYAASRNHFVMEKSFG